MELLCHAHVGVCMEAYLDEVDMGRIALSYQFSLDVLCDKTSSLLLVNGQVFVGERIQMFLSRDDLLNPRETSQFQKACEWFGSGWTVILSPLIHVVRRPSWDLLEELMNPTEFG